MKTRLIGTAFLVSSLFFTATSSKAEMFSDEDRSTWGSFTESSIESVLDADELSLKPDAEKGCCGCCDSCCDGCCESCCKDLLFGVIRPTGPCFSDFISPMTNPVFFEDPRTLTEVRFFGLHHRVPVAAGGGDVQLYAMQIRAALTERLSIVAAKDGYVVSSHSLIDDGWADVTAGLKYMLYADCQKLLSAGLSYQFPIGSQRSFQGNGDGEFHVYLTGGARMEGCWHWISGSGFRLPVDTNDESQMWYWSNHIDRQLCNGVYLFGEVNWYHWMKSGANGLLSGIEGGDLFNFGSTAVAGNDIVTGGVGIKYKPHAGMELGIVWEAPLTDKEDVLDNRLTVDWILRY